MSTGGALGTAHRRLKMNIEELAMMVVGFSPQQRQQHGEVLTKIGKGTFDLEAQRAFQQHLVTHPDPEHETLARYDLDRRRLLSQRRGRIPVDGAM
jgi:hypothetical protein